MARELESTNSSGNARESAACFSPDAQASLAVAVRRYLEGGGVPDELGTITAALCKEAQQRGLTADATLREIRGALGSILAGCSLTSTDRAALVALAIDECVHAFYREQR